MIMEGLSRLCFFAGLISIPVSIGFWFMNPSFGAETFAMVSDEGLRRVFQQAHAERWGIFVGLWAPTLLILSGVFKK